MVRAWRRGVMGILDRLRANKQPETRSDDSYTAAVSKGLALAAVGGWGCPS